jgi:hypothetical protein
MMLKTADLKQIIDYLLVNPKPTEEETGAMLLNICQRLESLNVQNKKQDSAIDESRQSLGQLWQRKKKGQIYAAKRRVAAHKDMQS